MHFPHPLLVCDVGGTNVRLALQAYPGAPLDLLPAQKTQGHAGLPHSVRAALSAGGIRPRSMVVCAAGPLVGRRLSLTNADWFIDGPAIAEALGLDQGLLLNDFEAQALCLPSALDEWFAAIGPRHASNNGVRVVLGPGTGLGVAALLTRDGRHLSLASEASHIDFAPTMHDEATLWPHLTPVAGRITVESVISGAGLGNLHRARLCSLGLPPPSAAAADPVAINAAAVRDAASVEAETVRLFWRLTARFAGDMAITFMADGGIVLAGGVLPRLASLIEPAAFRAAFERKAPVGHIVRAISTRLLMYPEAVLLGMAAIASAPHDYAIDYAARAWR